MYRPVTAFMVQGLRQESRSLVGHLLRGLVLGATLLSLFRVTITAWNGGLGAAGLTLYDSLMAMNGFWIWLAAGFFFAGCISAEREEGTLALLRLTGMSTLALLMGKIGHRLVATLVLLVGQFPFALLAVTLGGVSPEQIFEGFVTLGAYLLVASSLGVLLSTLCPSHLLAACLTLGLLGAVSVMQSAAAVAGLDTGLLEWLYPLSHLMDLRVGADLTETTLVLLRSALVSLPMLGVAWLRLSRITHERADVARVSTSRAAVAARRVRAQGGAALLWKEYRYNVGGRRGMVVRTLVYGALIGVICWCVAQQGGATQLARPEIWAGTLLGVGAAGLCLETALMTGRIVRPEINERSLANLAMLPFSVHKLLWWKTLGSYVGALLPLPLLLISGILWWQVAAAEVDSGDGMQLLGMSLAWSLAVVGLVVPLWILYLLLVLWLSLLLRWGAWLVGFFLWSVVRGVVTLALALVITPLILLGSSLGHEVAAGVAGLIVGVLFVSFILWGVYALCVSRLRVQIYS